MGSGLTAQERTIVMYNGTHRYKNLSEKLSGLQRFHFSKEHANELLKFEIFLLFRDPFYPCQRGSRIYSCTSSIKQLRALGYPNQAKLLQYQLNRFLSTHREHERSTVERSEDRYPKDRPEKKVSS